MIGINSGILPILYLVLKSLLKNVNIEHSIIIVEVADSVVINHKFH